MQLNPLVGDPLKNAEHFLKSIPSTTDLVISSELFFIGYPCRDLLSIKELLIQEIEALKLIKDFSLKNPDQHYIIGHTRASTAHGSLLFNCASHLHQGKIIKTIRKRKLPNYAIFNEERFFIPELKAQDHLLTIKDQTFFVEICEDAWSDISAFDSKDIRPDAKYSQVCPYSQLQNADAYINLSASPYHLGKTKKRLGVFKEIAKTNSIPVFFCSQVGAQDNILFDGSSFVLDSKGKQKLQAPFSQEAVNTISLLFEKTQKIEVISDWQELESILSLAIKDYCSKTKHDKLMLGLSGGIDSALCAYLACLALPQNNLKALYLPSQFSSQLSKQLSEELAKNLGFELITHPIESLYKSFLELFPKTHKHSPLSLENLQSRIRGTLLMKYSNEENRLLIATGNKSELAMGYATLYGDMNGAFSPIGDLYKNEVYGLCHYLNYKYGNKIPSDLLQRAPSAELAADQVDQDSLPHYDILDTILKYYIEKQGSFNDKHIIAFNDLLKKSNSPIDLNKVLQLFSRSEFKRFQASVIFKVQERSFGSGWDMPILKKLPLKEFPDEP